MTPRRTARPQPRRPKQPPISLRAAVGAILAFCLCLGTLAAALSGFFTVKRVEVVGANLPIGRIVQASDVYGKNIFRIRSDQVVARLASVRNVTVDRVDTSFPDRVTIHASLRQAMAAWANAGVLYLIDAQGNVIGQTRSTALPIITEVNWHPRQPLGSGVVEAVRYAVQVLPGAPSGAIGSFQFSNANGLTIVGKSGWQANVGGGNSQTLAARIATLVAFLKKIGPRAAQVRTIELRTSTPYARYVGSP